MRVMACPAVLIPLLASMQGARSFNIPLSSRGFVAAPTSIFSSSSLITASPTSTSTSTLRMRSVTDHAIRRLRRSRFDVLPHMSAVTSATNMRKRTTITTTTLGFHGRGGGGGNGGARRAISTTALYAAGPFLYVPPFSSIIPPAPSNLPPDVQSILNDINVALIVISALFFPIAIYILESPKGWVDETAVYVKPSTVPGAGLGLFARRDIPAGFIFGSYGGYLRTPQQFFELKGQNPKSFVYVWKLQSGLLLDPTDRDGNLPAAEGDAGSYISLFGLGIMKVSTALARVNEPPPSRDVNVKACVREKEVIYHAERDIQKDEELFTDYGSDYDRRGYGGGGGGDDGGGGGGDAPPMY